MADVVNSPNEGNTKLNRLKQIPYTCSIIPVRIAQGLTQTDLARKIGTTESFVCMIEHEKYYPILETRIKIAKALNTDTSALWILREIEEFAEEIENKMGD